MKINHNTLGDIFYVEEPSSKLGQKVACLYSNDMDIFHKFMELLHDLTLQKKPSIKFHLSTYDNLDFDAQGRYNAKIEITYLNLYDATRVRMALENG